MLGLAAVVALVAGNGYFVASEFALVAADRTRLEQQAHDGDRVAGRVLDQLQNLSYHLSGAQVGITVTSLLLGFVAEPTATSVIEPLLDGVVTSSHGWSLAIALVLATGFQMVFGELVPKAVGIANPNRIARILHRPVRWWGMLIRPFIIVLNGVANALIRRLGVAPREELDSTPSMDELEIMIRSSGEEGGLEPDAVALLTRSIRFGEKIAADALIPRVEVVALAENDTVETLVAESVRTGFSRFPVYRVDLDDVVGVVHVKSVYGLDVAERGQTSVQTLMTDIRAVPEARSLDDLLEELRETGNQLAVVVEEHGGTAGIITLEDVLEEIVGEIDDEHDAAAGPNSTKVEQRGSFVLPASLHGHEVHEATGFDMPEGDYETIAGFVLSHLGHIPEPGERIEHEGWRIEVVAMQRLRIATVRLAAPPEPVPESEQSGSHS